VKPEASIRDRRVAKVVRVPLVELVRALAQDGYGSLLSALAVSGVTLGALKTTATYELIGQKRDHQRPED
jgi:hypothetical protein